MIRTKPPSDEYRDSWDRVFGGDDAPPAEPQSDGISMRIKSYLWHCKTCDALVSDPENHQYHAVIVTETPE